MSVTRNALREAQKTGSNVTYRDESGQTRTISPSGVSRQVSSTTPSSSGGSSRSSTTKTPTPKPSPLTSAQESFLEQNPNFSGTMYDSTPSRTKDTSVEVKSGQIQSVGSYAPRTQTSSGQWEKSKQEQKDTNFERNLHNLTGREVEQHLGLKQGYGTTYQKMMSGQIRHSSEQVIYRGEIMPKTLAIAFQQQEQQKYYDDIRKYSGKGYAVSYSADDEGARKASQKGVQDHYKDKQTEVYRSQYYKPIEEKPKGQPVLAFEGQILYSPGKTQYTKVPTIGYLQEPTPAKDINFNASSSTISVAPKKTFTDKIKGAYWNFMDKASKDMRQDLKATERASLIAGGGALAPIAPKIALVTGGVGLVGGSEKASQKDMQLGQAVKISDLAYNFSTKQRDYADKLYADSFLKKWSYSVDEGVNPLSINESTKLPTPPPYKDKDSQSQNIAYKFSPEHISSKGKEYLNFMQENVGKATKTVLAPIIGTTGKITSFVGDLAKKPVTSAIGIYGFSKFLNIFGKSASVVSKSILPTATAMKAPGYVATGLGVGFVGVTATTAAKHSEKPAREFLETALATAWTIPLMKRAVDKSVQSQYLKETPIKGKSIQQVTTTRKTVSGKIVQDKQMVVTTELGKPKVRHVKDPSKIKVRKEVSVDGSKNILQHFRFGGLKQTQTTAKSKGKLKLKEGGKKARYSEKEYSELGKPTEILSTSTAYTGKLPTGTPLKGITPRFKPKTQAVKSTKTRKGYEYQQAQWVSGWYKDGKFSVVTKPGKMVRVPETSKTKVNIVTDRLYGKPKHKGELLAEETFKGKFVKRKYVKTEKTPDKIDFGYIEKPNVIVEIGKKGNVKAYNILESGKKISYKGEKPEPLYKFENMMKGTTSTGATGTKQEVVLQPKTQTTTQQATTTTQKPVINVLSQRLAEPKTRTAVIPQQHKYAPKIKQQYLPDVEKVLPRSILFQRQERKLDYDSEIKQKSMVLLKSDIQTIQQQEPIVMSKLETGTLTKKSTRSVSLHKQIQAPKQKSDILPAIDVVREVDHKQKQSLLFRPQFQREMRFTPEPLIEPPPPAPGLFNFKGKSTMSQDSLWKGFDVFVRRKGKFEQINVGGALTKDEAYKLGKKQVSTTLAATFKIKESDEFVSKPSKEFIKDEILKDQFYEKDGMYIEKPTYRLSTRGEKREIGMFADMAQQTKSFLDEANKILPKAMNEFATPWIVNEGKGRSKKKSKINKGVDNFFGGKLKW